MNTSSSIRKDVITPLSQETVLKKQKEQLRRVVVLKKKLFQETRPKRPKRGVSACSRVSKSSK
jgi:hypothetical protein